MINLKDWTAKNANRPLGVALAAVSFLFAAYFAYLSHARYSAQLRRIERVVDTATLGIQQDNRPLIESALMMGLHDSDSAAAAICRGTAAELLYPPSTEDPCAPKREWLLPSRVRRRIAGAEDRELVFTVDWLRTFMPLLVLLAITALLSAATLLLLMRARRRFESEVLEPLSLGLNGDQPLGIHELDELRKQNLAHAALTRRQAVSDALFELSTQVAHDIRSPLAALEVAAGIAAALPEEHRRMIQQAVDRVRGIADSLLARYRLPVSAVQDPVPAAVLQPLRGLITPLIDEKRLQFRSASGVRIEFVEDPSPQPAIATVQPVEFNRVLSNLINNAVEALGNDGGAVRVRLSTRGSTLLVSVQDDGAGIPPDVLARLGRRGETHGKSSGTGLGLHHARSCAESWGGSLEIVSRSGEGTTVTLFLPAAQAMPTRAAGASEHRDTLDAVLIDDDPLARATWHAAAARHGKKLRSFADAADFFSAASEIDPATPVYVDSELGGGSSGAVESQRIHESGFSRIYLATGHEPSKFEGLAHIRGVTGKTPPWS